uniref:Uncharacterized protein n=1 Tax=Arundo donax TaxID=35708 RepID=A0A0A8YP68_ARUDO
MTLYVLAFEKIWNSRVVRVGLVVMRFCMAMAFHG